MQPARKSNVEVKTVYEPPVLRRITLQQAKIVVSSQIKTIVRIICPGRNEPIFMKPDTGKNYEKPTLKKLTSEQAKLLLIGQSSIGKKSANELLNLIFPDPNDSRPH